MKKGFLFLTLFLLLIGGVYFYQKNQTRIVLNSLPTKIIPSKEAKREITITQNQITLEETNQGLILEIDQPKDKKTVNSSSIIVSGKTSPSADVFINEKELKADSQGNFKTTINLDEGENIIAVVASDSQGNYAEKELTVILETLE